MALSLTSLFILTGCGAKRETSENSTAPTEPTKVKVDVVGENNEVWNFVKEKLAKENIEIEIVSFTDYNQPNDALVNGDIELNSFQHKIFLEPITESSQPYVNIIVARSADVENETYKKIVAAYQSDDTKKIIEETYKGSYVPVW